MGEMCIYGGRQSEWGIFAESSTYTLTVAVFCLPFFVSFLLSFFLSFFFLFFLVFYFLFSFFSCLFFVALLVNLMYPVVSCARHFSVFCIICLVCLGFPNSVVGVLMDFLNGDGAMDVILFVRSIVEQYEVRKSSRYDVLYSTVDNNTFCTTEDILNHLCLKPNGLWRCDRPPPSPPSAIGH